MSGAPDPDWYLDNVLAQAMPGGPQQHGSFLPAARWRHWWRLQHDALDPRLASHVQGFVVQRARVRSLGISDADVRRLIRHKAWSTPLRGTIAPLRVPAASDDADERLTWQRREHALQAAAAALVRPGQVVSARSSAILHGLPTFSVPARPELNATPAVTAGRHGRPLVRTGALTDADVTSWFGAPVVTIARTLADLGRHDARDAIMATDAALREGLVSRAELERALDQQKGWPGVRRSREVLRLGRAESESPLESLLRLALHDSGFPSSDLQVAIGPYRVDLLWPRARLILEADGRGKNSAAERWREKRRDLYLHRAGYRVERVTWEDVVRTWPSTSTYLRGLLVERLPPSLDQKS